MILRRASLLVAAILLSTSIASDGADWSMGRFEADQRSYTTEKLAPPLALAWEYTASKYDNNSASPVVAGKTCFFACGDRIYAVDTETGAFKWKYPTDQGLSGSVKASPAVYGGMVYFGSGDGSLYCVSAEKGTFQWAYQTRGAIRCPPAIVDGVIYVGSDDNSLYAIDAGSGDSAWTRQVTVRDDIASGIAIGAGMAVIAGMDGNIYGVNASSGKLRWMTRLSAAPVNSSPIIVGNVAVMAVSNSVYGYATRSGQLRWALNLPSEVAATPAADDQAIYIPCTNKKVYAYTVTGRQPVLKWTEPADLGAGLMSSPIISGEMMFITGSKGVISAFSTVDGSLKWRYMAAPSSTTMPGALYTDAASSATAANGALYVLTDDGVLHCFAPNAPDGEPPAIFEMNPANATALSGAPPIKMSALLYDIGSGVDFSSVTMELDGQPVDYEAEPGTSKIFYETETGANGKAMKRLSDGVHTVKVTAKDYMGNLLVKEWFFIADNSLPPPRKVQAEPPPGKRTRQPGARPTPPAPAERPSRPRPNEGGYEPPGPPPPPMPPGFDAPGGPPPMPGPPGGPATSLPPSENGPA